MINVALLCTMTLATLVATSAHAEVPVTTLPPMTAGPGLAFVVRNDSNKAHEYAARSFLTGRCDKNPNWPRQQLHDVRLDKSAKFRIEPGGWVVKTVLFSAEDANCEVESHLKVDGVETSWRSRVSLSPKYQKPEQVAVGATKFRLSTSVVDEGPNQFIEPTGKALQVQILVENPSAQSRVVAVIRRRLTCPAANDFDWIVGPGAAIGEIASGPSMIAAGSWLVFSQRVRGTAEPAACRVSFELAELRHGRPEEQFSPPRWIEIGTVETTLNATVEAEYR